MRTENHQFSVCILPLNSLSVTGNFHASFNAFCSLYLVSSSMILMNCLLKRFNNFVFAVSKTPVTKVISAPAGTVSLAHGVQFNAAPHLFPSSPAHAALTVSAPSQVLSNEKPPTSVITQNYTPPNGGTVIPTSAPVVEPLKKDQNLATAESKPPAKTETEPPVPSRDFVDPLTFKVKELESEYTTRTPGETGTLSFFLG